MGYVKRMTGCALACGLWATNSLAAVGTLPLAAEEVNLASVLLKNQGGIAIALKAEGIEGPVEVLSGTSFQSNVGSNYTRGYVFTLTQCETNLPMPCAPLGQLTIAIATTVTPAGPTEVTQVQFVRQ